MSLINSFTEQFRAAEVFLRTLVTLGVGQPAARDDVMQEIARALWQAFPRFEKNRPFQPWAAAIARHKIADWQRRQHREGRGLLSAAALASPPPESTPDASEVRIEALVACLGHLPPASAQLLDRRYRDGLRAEALAAEFSTSPDAIYQTLSRLRRALAACIEQRLSLSPTAHD